MNLSQLQYFVKVAQLKSFSRAAHELDIAQSAVSRQIQAVERELGTVLFLRSTRNVQLTEAGFLFLQRAQSILGEVNSLKREVADHAKIPRGTLRLGVLSFIGEMVLPEVILKYTSLFPDVTIRLSTGMSRHVLDWLDEEQIDLAILRSPRATPNLIIEQLVLGEMALVFPLNNRAARFSIEEKDAYSILDIADLPLIISSIEHVQREILEGMIATYGKTPRILVEADNVNVIGALVESGIGYSLLSYTSAYTVQQHYDIRIASIEGIGLRTDLSIVTRRDRPVTAAMRAMISQLKSEIRKLADAGKLPERYFTPATGASRSKV